MTLDAKDIPGLAGHLQSCRRRVRDTLKITDAHPQMDWDDADATQARPPQRRRFFPAASARP